MDPKDYFSQQFATLRREIEGQQARLFWIVVIGLLGMPTLSYFLLSATTRIWMMLPFLLLVLILLYLSEQSHIMRAGRYIREHIEKRTELSPGWEEWLESRAELRLMDKHFSACFVILFFLYYFLSVAFSLHRLAQEALDDPSGLYWWWFYAATAVYAIATIWGLATLLQHWRSSMTTAPEPKRG